MQRYELATPRLTLGTAAVALAATTLAVLVIIPATMDVDAHARAPVVAAPGQDNQLAAAPCVLQPGAVQERPERKDAAL